MFINLLEWHLTIFVIVIIDAQLYLTNNFLWESHVMLSWIPFPYYNKN